MSYLDIYPYKILYFQKDVQDWRFAGCFSNFKDADYFCLNNKKVFGRMRIVKIIQKEEEIAYFPIEDQL